MGTVVGVVQEKRRMRLERNVRLLQGCGEKAVAMEVLLLTGNLFSRDHVGFVS